MLSDFSNLQKIHQKKEKIHPSKNTILVFSTKPNAFSILELFFKIYFIVIIDIL